MLSRSSTISGFAFASYPKYERQSKASEETISISDGMDTYQDKLQQVGGAFCFNEKVQRCLLVIEREGVDSTLEL